MKKSKVAAVALAGLITFSSLGSATAAVSADDLKTVKGYVVTLKKAIKRIEANQSRFVGLRKQAKKGSLDDRKYRGYIAKYDDVLFALRARLAADQELLILDVEEYHAQGSNQ